MQYEPLFTMKLYSHFFKITNVSLRARSVIHFYRQKYTSKIFIKERGRWVSKLDKVYGAQTTTGTEYRFNINQLAEFKEFLEKNYIKENLYTVETMPTPSHPWVSLPLRPEKQAREYQEPIINFVTDKNGDRTKFIGIQPGKGKGFISMASFSQLGYKVAANIKPAYLTKWFDELREILDVGIVDIMVVQGGDHLRGLIQLARDRNLRAKFVLISNRTYQNYIKAYELDPYGPDFLSYECHPDEFYELLGVSLLLFDEVHQDFHANFKTMLYANVQLVVALSATLINNNPFIEKMYEVAFPKATRYDLLALDKYIKMYPVAYNFKEPAKIRTTEYGGTSYSHIAFEKSIMGRPHVLQPYVAMLKYLIDISYVKHYQAGDKVLIFAGSIAMCTYLVNRFKHFYPNRDVRRYVEDDPYENILTAEICVTTLLSGGTAIDIEGLRVVIMSISVDSAQANIQGPGRLRKLADRDVKFYYTYCEQIPKQKEYHQRRVALLRDRVESIKDTPYPFPI